MYEVEVGQIFRLPVKVGQKYLKIEGSRAKSPKVSLMYRYRNRKI